MAFKPLVMFQKRSISRREIGNVFGVLNGGATSLSLSECSLLLYMHIIYIVTYNNVYHFKVSLFTSPISPQTYRSMYVSTLQLIYRKVQFFFSPSLVIKAKIIPSMIFRILNRNLLRGICLFSSLTDQAENLNEAMSRKERSGKIL